ncbi:hypothetical protein B0H14DRAFT_3495114 [Mycena olivaceomarginata]|nr:hypothetical protein B0H14DRAFT_3495114 [Mycena olivaceomarginata]
MPHPLITVFHRNVLQGLLERAIQHPSPESRHRDRHARHPVTPVVHNPDPTPNQVKNSYTRLALLEEPRIGDADALPNFGAVAPILQRAPGSVPDMPSRSSASGVRKTFRGCSFW